jgi:hypothetical protein
MSSVVELLRSGNRTARTRLLMIGAVIGAIAALGVSMTLVSPQSNGAVGGPGGSGPQGGGPASPDAEHGTNYAFEAPVGSCLSWEDDDAADMRKVDCADAHVFEVTEVIDIASGYPAGAPLPKAETWRYLAKKRCTKGAETYLDKDLDPAGKLQVAALAPNEGQWKKGNRELRCGLWRVGPGGSLQATKGPAEDANQSDIWATGTCLALKGKSVGDPINCRERHSYEMISVVNLANKFTEYPSKDEQDEWLDRTCTKAARTYSGGEDLKKLKLIVSWDTRTKASWAAGSQLVNCKVAALLADKSGLAAVTGSIKAAPKSSGGSKDDDKPSSTPSTKPSS